MPQYLYTAMNGAGKECKGKIVADSEDAAVLELRAKNIYVTSLRVAVKANCRRNCTAISFAGCGAETLCRFLLHHNGDVIKRKPCL